MNSMSLPQEKISSGSIQHHQHPEIRDQNPDVVIHVAPDRAELVETRIIDGRKCLVIPMESEIELNGIRVSTLNSVEDTSAEPLPVNDITDIDNSNTEEEIPF